MDWERLRAYICLTFILQAFSSIKTASSRNYDRQDLVLLREEVRQMFEHAYSSYVKYAYPYDELRPLTCDGIDTWGSYSLTLIDALDTLVVMGNYSEFRRVVDIVTANADFDANINVSVFETNIRIVGGLLSAHLLSQRAGVEVEAGWPCNGKLLRLAEDVARRLLPAFDTPTGMPYGTVNLRHGVPPSETSVTCTAGVGTFILEFATLSRLTGDPIYEEVALNALERLYAHRSSIGLFGNHIDVMSGRWTAQDSGIGAGVDSYFEYLVKGSILLGRPQLMAMFNRNRRAIDKYLKKNNWYVWASMHKGQVTLPVFQSLEAYWPGVLALIGDVEDALRSMHNYNRIWKQYGFTPEFYNIGEGEAGANRESYPLRPELAESAMYLYRATGDPFMLDIGVNILRSIQHSARTSCGYATIKDARDHSLENRMESFFLAETTKYLYLLFDPDNFIHNKGDRGRLHTLHSGRQCVLDAGGYIFNTEAHPIDPGALLCCHDNSDSELNNDNYDKDTKDTGGSGHFQSTKSRYASATSSGGVHHFNNFRGEQLGDKHRKKHKKEEEEEEVHHHDEDNIVKGLNNQAKVERKKDAQQEEPDKKKKPMTVTERKQVEQIVETWTLKAELAKALLETESRHRTGGGTNSNSPATKPDINTAVSLQPKTATVEDTNHRIEETPKTQLEDESPKPPPPHDEENKLETEFNREALERLSEIVESRRKREAKKEAEEVKRQVLRILTGAKEAIHNLEKLKQQQQEQQQKEQEEKERPELETKETMTKEEEPLFRQDYYYEGGDKEQDGGGATTTPTKNNNNNDWKDDNFSYQIDDQEEKTPSTRKVEVAPPPPPKLDFDPQQLLERIRSRRSSRFGRHTSSPHSSSSSQYTLLTCNAQPFTTRLTIAGEFLDEK